MTEPLPDRRAITAAAVAIHDVDCPDRKCSGPALGHCYRLAEAALAAAVPITDAQAAAAERARILADVNALFDGVDILTTTVKIGFQAQQEVLESVRNLIGGVT